jgi:hypothetical protein
MHNYAEQLKNDLVKIYHTYFNLCTVCPIRTSYVGKYVIYILSRVHTHQVVFGVVPAQAC